MAEEKKRYKIAIVDDNREIVQVLNDIFTIRNFEVVAAYGGREGIEVIKKHHPHLVILDITMPDMDGRDVLNTIKRDEALKHIPVMILTGRDIDFDRECTLGLGAYEFIQKPFDTALLIRQATSIIEKSEQGRA